MSASTSSVAQILCAIKVSMTPYKLVRDIGFGIKYFSVAKLIASSHLHNDEDPPETDPVASRAPVLCVCACVCVHVYANGYLHIVNSNGISLCVYVYA